MSVMTTKELRRTRTRLHRQAASQAGVTATLTTAIQVRPDSRRAAAITTVEATCRDRAQPRRLDAHMSALVCGQDAGSDRAGSLIGHADRSVAGCTENDERDG